MNIKRNIALSDSGFVFDPSTGDSYSANPIGMEVIKMLKEQKSNEEIKDYVLNTYQTDEATFEKDFYDFVKMLEQNRLIEKSHEQEKN